MRVLLVHVPPGKGIRATDRSESLGLGYVASALRKAGHEVEVFDAHLQYLDVRQATQAMARKDFDCLGVTGMHQDKDVVAEVVRSARKSRKDALIVVGGYLPTMAPEKFMTFFPEVDFCVVGEGEQVVCDVLGKIERSEEWQESPGIAYRKADLVVTNPPPPLIKDLDSLAFPARDALRQGPATEWASIASSRGCYHRCSFCSVNAFYELSGGHAPRFRSAGNVVDEIQSIVAEHGMRKFTFVDDDFIGPGKAREHSIAIVEEIKARKLDINFSMECRADEIDEDILAFMKDAGLTGVFLGIESGVQRQLDTYNKRVTVEQNRAAIELVRRLGIAMQPGFIPFDPYLTPEELQQNLDFAKEVNLWEGKSGPTPLRIILYPGVPLIDRVRADGLLTERGMDYDYRFKDPQTRTIWRGFRFMSKVSEVARKITGRRPR